jgi:hypothetical protein
MDLLSCSATRASTSSIPPKTHLGSEAIGHTEDGTRCSRQNPARRTAFNLGIKEELLVLTAATTGLRRSELAGLKWSDMDPRQRLDQRKPRCGQHYGEPLQDRGQPEGGAARFEDRAFLPALCEVSPFKASDDYVFAAGSNRAGGKRGKQPSLWPWFSGITSSQ